MSADTYLPNRDDFATYATRGTLIPVYRELAADLETPVSVFLKVRGDGAAFLLESVEKGEQQGRYSILGVALDRAIVAHGRTVTVTNGVERSTRPLEGREDALHVVKSLLSAYQPVEVPGVPRFHGGAVGYLGYDAVAAFEPVLNFQRGDSTFPDLYFLLTDTLVIFDHVKHRLLVIANAFVTPDHDLSSAYDEAVAKIEAIVAKVQQPLTQAHLRPSLAAPQNATIPSAGDFTPSVSREAFEENVRHAKEHIAAGDIFQVVLSQRLARQTHADPFTIYRALRRINPSPYMFFFDLPGTSQQPDSDALPPERIVLIGASPEMLVRLEGQSATVRPIAGTRPRGAERTADDQYATDLLADPKERAEHVMLVDLGRNDLGRVCDYGTVKVNDFMVVERYSHVMHLVSDATGTLCPDKDGFDLVRATFPAGTVSGAPKIRAMQLIEELEQLPRDPYAGGVGYFGYNGNVDTCITIRTIWMKGDTAYIQAGAGIVADSDPATEWQETMHKARALGAAIELAERGA